MTRSIASVLMRRPSVSLADGALTFMDRVPPDIVLAEHQHEVYRDAVTGIDVALIDVPRADAFPDATFVEDVVLAFPECFVLCRPGAASRVDEPDLIVPYLPTDRPIYRITSPATLDGGDVLQIRREVFVGLSTRTNMAAVSALSALLQPHLYAVTAVQVTGSLHLKTAVTAIRDDMLLANAEWVDLAPFGKRQIVSVDAQEPFAGNSLRIGDQLFMQSAHALTAARLRSRGVAVSTLDISEFAKIEAGLTCMSVVIPATLATV
jgi:dimethylargininase